jgi:PASTA domain
VVVHVYNLYGRLDGPFCGNPSKPKSVSEDSRNRAKEARAQRPSLGDLLLPYKKPIVTLLVLGGLGYGGFAYNKSSNNGLVKLFESAKASLTPKPSEPKKSGGKSGGGKTTGGGGGNSSSNGRPSGGKSSSGGGVSNKISVPRVVGDDVATAEQTLIDSGFRVVKKDTASKAPADQVVKQVPGSGSKLAPGATVRIWFSKGAGSDEGAEPASAGGEETKPDAGEEETTKPDAGGEQEGASSSSGEGGE